MRMVRFVAVLLFLACLSSIRPTPWTVVGAQSRSFEQGLADLLARYHTQFDVYSDASAAGNHFNARGCMRSDDLKECGSTTSGLPPMVESAECPSRSGTCIRATARLRGRQWGGWYFLNGVLPDAKALPSTSVGKGIAPDLNWGSVPDAGVDLTGATELSFDVMGSAGGELIEFFAFGVGHDGAGKTAIDPATKLPYVQADSARKATSGYVSLTKQWKRIPISLRGLTPSYVLGGFGWVTDAGRNGGKDVTFWLDNVRYDKSRPTEPRFPLSFDQGGAPMPVARELQNVAFTYDAAVALTAFVAAGDLTNARLIADALVEAQAHDRMFDDGRLRNAYQAGDLFVPPGWTPNGRRGTVRLPGWYDEKEGRWFEDRSQVSSDSGNLAWAAIGLLSYVEASANRLSPQQRTKYVDALVKLGSWIETNCRDARAGYTGGLERAEPAPEARSYRSTEHNLDLTSAFDRLATVTGDSRWKASADHARAFVLSMFDETEGKFWTGTLAAPGDTNAPNTKPVPLDVQSWSVLSLGPRDASRWTRALAFAQARLRSGDGFAFSDDDTSGVWYEGTAQMAVAYRTAGRNQEADRLVSLLRRARQPSGLLSAASKDGLRTGFGWTYFRWAHTGATAWAVLAERGVNPFAPFPPLPAR